MIRSDTWLWLNMSVRLPDRFSREEYAPRIPRGDHEAPAEKKYMA